MSQAGAIATMSSERPPTLSSVSSHERSLTPMSSLALSRHLSTCERADKSMQTDFFPSNFSMRGHSMYEGDCCLRHQSPGNRMTPQMLRGQSEDRFVEMIRPTCRLGDLDSVYVTTEESATVQIPELLDYAESNLEAEAQAQYSGRPVPLRSGGVMITHVSDTRPMPLIMQNKFFLGKMSQQLKKTIARGWAKHGSSAAKKPPSTRQSCNEPLSAQSGPTVAQKPVRRVRATFASFAPSPVTKKLPHRAVKSASQKSLLHIELIPKRVIVNLQDFSSREARSNDRSFWSSEPENPLAAPVPHVNEGLVDEIQPLISEEQPVVRLSDGYNLVSKYRKTVSALTLLEEDEGEKLRAVQKALRGKSGTVRHGVKSFDLVERRLQNLGRAKTRGGR